MMMYGIVGSLFDFAFMCVDANRGGIIGMMWEYLLIMFGLKVFFFVIVIKVDMVSEENRVVMLDVFMKMFKRSGVYKTFIFVRDDIDVMIFVKNIVGGVIMLIF